MKLPQSTNILLLGSGGREAAFAYKIAQSTQLGQLYIAPGNGGTAQWGMNVDIDPLDFTMIKHFALRNSINLIVVGPEEPLVRGVRDFFISDDEVRHIPVLGPSAAAAQMEGSKNFSKAFMARHNIPTAKYFTVSATNIDEGCQFLDSLNAPYVLKADGLAAGKGVLIINDISEAKAELRSMIEDQKFGKASVQVVIEEFLSGIECSVFVATDGHGYKILPVAKDYKRIGNGDTGLNTGGMGAVSPVPFADKMFMDKVIERIVEPTVRGVEAEELDYVGFIFIGLMNCGGEPFVIEYNVRMGDPETEVVLPLIESDILDLFDGMVHGTLAKKEVRISTKTAVTVVCTSGGYPGAFDKGFSISGLDTASKKNSIVFQAGTKNNGTEIITSGGRVLAVTSIASSIEEAAALSYATIEDIDYAKKYFRTDIGTDLM